jgi:Spy/CpxP family protein refolding chaperone
MKMNKTAKLVMVAAATFIIGIASVASAEDVTKNVDAPEKMCPCPLQKGMGKFHGGMGMAPGHEALSEEQNKKLEAERTTFHNATRDLRQELKSKRFALRSELAKKEPDAKTAKALQKDISALDTELGQKRIEHLLVMKKIAPYCDMGQMGEDREGPEGGRFRRM